MEKSQTKTIKKMYRSNLPRIAKFSVLFCPEINLS